MNKLSRRCLLKTGVALSAATVPLSESVSTHAAAGSVLLLSPTRLHGYGTLSAHSSTLSDGLMLTSIHCESAAAALLTQAKFLSDLAAIPGISVADTQGYSVWHTPNGAAIVCAAVRTEVSIYVGISGNSLTEIVTLLRRNTTRPAEVRARTRVPMWLDRWDKHGLLCYFSPEATPPNTPYLDQNFDYTSGLQFVKDQHMGLVVWSYPLPDDNSEGITTEQSWSWVQENARRMQLPVHINTQINPPQLWLANRWRGQTMLKAPQFLGGYYGVGHDSTGLSAISWLSDEAEDAVLGVFQHTVRRFAADPNIVGWLEPHGETYESPQKFFLDYGPHANAAYGRFLKQRFPSLAALSRRWFGREDALKSWQDIRLPEIAEFVGFNRTGDASNDALDLQAEWRTRAVPAPDWHTYTLDEARGLPSPPPTAPVPEEWYQRDYDDSEWDLFTMPGSDRQLSLARSPRLFRRHITISEQWLKHAPQITLVVWDMANRDKDATVLYVNGDACTRQTSHNANDRHWSEFDVAGMLHAGENQISLLLPRGICCYRIYITKARIRKYMQDGNVGENARWVDFVEFQVESRGRQIERGADMIRQVDPHRSINFMAADDYFEPVRKICQKYGGRFHDTGGMAGYWTEANSLMMGGARLPVTAEPGNGAPNERELQLFWGRWITEGVNGVHYFQSWGEIAWNPEVLKRFEACRKMYEMVGKYHAPFPQTAVLFSLRSGWLPDFPFSPEGAQRGGYESVFNAATQLLNHCPRVGVNPHDFETGAAQRYRVIIDSNTCFMDERLASGIEAYVRAGGIFITFGQTGRHTPLEPDKWMLSRLAGVKIAGIFGWGDGRSAKAAAGQVVYPDASAGFHEPAMLSTEALRCGGLRLTPAAADCKTLLIWDDDAHSAAVITRKVGKGSIVVLGPEVNGDAFVRLIAPLLRHFGVTDRVPAMATPLRGLHFRHFVGNAGLHDLWVLFNESDEDYTTDLSFLPGVNPGTLTDVLSGEALTPESATGYSHWELINIHLNRHETRMFVSIRSAKQLLHAPAEWLQLQAGWWQGTTTPPVHALPTPQQMQINTLELCDGWAYKRADGLSDGEAAALAATELDDKQWERRTLGLWLFPGNKGVKRIILRRKFTVPAGWQGRDVMLCADVPYAQFFHETRIFLDGSPWENGRKTADGPYQEAFGGLLQPGTSHVLTLDIQSHCTLMGCRGPIWLNCGPDLKAVQRIDLSGTWRADSSPTKRGELVSLPGTAKGQYFVKQIHLNAEHRDKQVTLCIEATGDRFSVLINGSLIKTGELWRTHLFRFEISPLLRFGEENVIEIAGNSAGEKKILSVELQISTGHH